MIKTKIRCNKCDTVLDTEKLQIKEQQESCKCGKVSLDWHGHKILGFREHIDTLGDDELSAELKKHDTRPGQVKECLEQYYDGLITEAECNEKLGLINYLGGVLHRYRSSANLRG